MLGLIGAYLLLIISYEVPSNNSMSRSVLLKVKQYIEGKTCIANEISGILLRGEIKKLFSPNVQE